MRKEVKEIPKRVIETFIYDKEGESPDGKYKVGQKVKAYLYKEDDSFYGILEGSITEICYSPERELYQLRINNGWCCHPREYWGNDVVIIDKGGKR